MLRELVELEPEAKWPRAGLLGTLARLAPLLASPEAAAPTGTAQNAGADGEAAQVAREWAETLEALKSLDPPRAGYYASLSPP